MSGIPGLIIAVILNSFTSLSFGPVFFPASFVFPDAIPRSIGVQMFLFSTVVCQVVMSSVSIFPCAMGLMMVENLPFMHTIADEVQHRHGHGTLESMSTVMMAFAVSSVVVGIFFYLLGALNLGSAVHFFPRHVIVGCIGGVGIFVLKTGFEVSTSLTWTWDSEALTAFGASDVAPLWLVSCAYEVGLRILMSVFDASILPPFYFVMIPPTFYVFLFIFGFSTTSAHEAGWFFGPHHLDSSHSEEMDVDPFLLWKLIDLQYVQWITIVKLTPTIIALTIFSLMHVPINIPSLSISTGIVADMNTELKAHGISNVVAGMLGGCQNYVCYSNS